MKMGRDVTGLPVIDFSTGKKTYKVQDVIFDATTNRVLGLLVDEGGWFGTAKVLPMEKIKSIGEDAVVFQDQADIVAADNDPSIASVMKEESVLKGTKLMTESGKKLGTLSDIQFDEASGAVTGYEVSGGTMADAYGGRSVVPANQPLRLGKDVAFVPDEVETILDQQAGGLKGAVQEAADTTKQAASSEKAAEYKDKAGSALDHTRDVVKEMAGTVKSDVKHLGHVVKEKALHYKDKATQEMEEVRIKKAVGHPASRVVMDHENKVILNTGDIITFAEVEKAKAAGVLDILLSSVYTKEPELKAEDMRVKAGVQ